MVQKTQALLSSCFTMVEQLPDGVIVREGAAPLDDLAQAVVQRLNRIGGVNHITDRRRVIEERCQTLPVPLPTRDNCRILLAVSPEYSIVLKFLTIFGIFFFTDRSGEEP